MLGKSDYWADHTSSVPISTQNIGHKKYFKIYFFRKLPEGVYWADASSTGQISTKNHADFVNVDFSLLKKDHLEFKRSLTNCDPKI